MNCEYCGAGEDPNVFYLNAGRPFTCGSFVNSSIREARCYEVELGQVKNKAAKLYSALVELVGSNDPGKLKEMATVMRIAPAPEADKVAVINAINTLLEYMGEELT